MIFDVRTRVGVWLLLMALVVAAASVLVLDGTERRLAGSAEDSLVQLVELERERLVAELDDQRADAEAIAADPDLLDGLLDDRDDGAAFSQLLETLLERTRLAGQDIGGLRLVDRDGDELGRTAAAVWQNPDLEADAMDRRSILVGETAPGSTLALVSPVVSVQGEVLGALTVETDLTQVVWLSSRYESFGDTSEAFVFQRLADGSCQLLTDLRFERSAAFTALEGDYAADCGQLPDDGLLRGVDYRGEATRSAWAEVDGTEWTVVVKMDDDEVFEVLRTLRRTIIVAVAAVAALMIAGWFVLVRSIGARLARAASAAEQLASGDYGAFIEDRRSDEIGRMSESINHLARDLAIDIERREMAETRLRVRADYDELTGLINRGRMMARLRELAGEGSEFTVVFLDLDGFKEINDTYGHSIGDEVLRLVAARLQTAIAQRDEGCALARWGGDEFVVLCPGPPSPEHAAMADALDRYFDEPFRTEAGEHHVGVSIGRADTSDGGTIEAVMSAADASMYRVKRRGDGRTRLSPQSIKFVEEALESDRVLSYLQPLIRVGDDESVQLAGAEALVRVRNDDGTLANPGSFLPGLGASEQALALDLRVLGGAAAAASRWHRAGLVAPDFAISANFGAAAMADPRLGDKIEAILDRHDLPFSNLVAEIPETAREVDLGLIDLLRRRGASIAIDDVGCMFSNLERLVDIPADFAKIDRRWVPAGGDEHSERLALLTGLVEQCRMLGLTVVVEGIETAEQLEILRGIGVDRVQGFFFGRPVEPSEFARDWVPTAPASSVSAR